MNIQNRSVSPIAGLQSPGLPTSASPSNSFTHLSSSTQSNLSPQPGEIPGSLSDPNASSPELKEAFTDFVGKTLFGSMLASMRKTVGKPAYMHGGRTEEVFQQQLDQHIVDDITESSADTVAGPMFELFNMQRRS